MRLPEGYEEGEAGPFWLRGRSCVKVVMEGSWAGLGGSWLRELMGDEAGLLGVSQMRDEFVITIVMAQWVETYSINEY